MIKEPYNSIDLFINLEKRKFTKDSEQLLIGLYAVDKYLKDYQHVDGSKYECQVPGCKTVEEHYSHLVYHVRKHVLTNDSQLKNLYAPKQQNIANDKQVVAQNA